jgi:hypothetical protein
MMDLFVRLAIGAAFIFFVISWWLNPGEQE